MRRSTEGVLGTEELRQRRAALAATASERDASRVIELLSPCVTDARRARIEAVLPRRLDSVAVLFDSPYDPHNGAAVLRSCDAFGVQHLHIVQRRKYPFLIAPTVSRGTEKWVDLVTHDRCRSAIDVA